MFWVAYTIQAAGAFLALWGITLFVRATWQRRNDRMHLPSPTVDIEEARPKHRLRMPRLVGAAAAALGAASWLLGVAGTRWLRGQTFGIWAPDTNMISAGAVLVVAVALATVGWRFHSARGGRRCPKCFYDCALIPSPTCPECGFTRQNWKLFERDVREPKLLVAAALLLPLASIGYRVPLAVKLQSWRPLIPSTVMVAGWKYLPESLFGAPSHFKGSLIDRIGGSKRNLPLGATHKSWLADSTRDALNTPDDVKALYRAVWLRSTLLFESERMSVDAFQVALAAYVLGTAESGPARSVLHTEALLTARLHQSPPWIGDAVIAVRNNPELLQGVIDPQAQGDFMIATLVGIAAAYDDDIRDELTQAFDRATGNLRSLDRAMPAVVGARPELEPWLRERVLVNSGQVRQMAAYAYQMLAKDEPVRSLLLEWMNDADPYLAAGAARACFGTDYHDEALTHLLDRFIADPCSNEPLLEIMYFGGVRDVRLVPFATQFVIDPSVSENVRVAACRFLGELRASSEAALPSLDHAAASNTSLAVAEAAGVAAAEIRRYVVRRPSE